MKKKKSNLDLLEKDLQQISVKEGFVPFEKFHKFLEKVKTHNNIINLLIDYLKKYTQKDYCIPDDIINIFKNLDYSLSLDDKKIFLFKMMLTIYGQEENLNYAQINKYLNIDYEKNNIIVNNNSDYYDEEQFLNNDKFKEMINNLNPYLESFGLIPYKYLKVKVNDKEKIKIIINNFLKNESDGKLEEYLEKNFNECSSFYAIDVNFWNNIVTEEEKIKKEIKLIEEQSKNEKEGQKKKDKKKNKKEKDKKKNKKEKDKKNNKNAYNIKGKKINDNNENIEAKPAKLKKGLKYKNDFIIVCGQLYEILSTNYKQDYIIKFTKLQTKIYLNKDNNNEEKKENDENEKKNNEKGEIKEDKKYDKKENQEKEEKEIKEKEEDYINKEKIFKENLNKFILDENNFNQLLINYSDLEKKGKVIDEKKNKNELIKRKMQDKLEKGKLENEKRQEMQEKERLKKEQEEKEMEENERLKTKKKEQEKIGEKEKKERREKEKEFISPPYGMPNLVNTCYFNSINQIFVNLPILQKLFLDERIEYFINKKNKFGHKGKLFESDKKLYRIEKKGNIYGTVQSLKLLVGTIKNDFNNYKQQDASEYLTFVLDNLHEEFNMHSSRKYIEEKLDIFNHNTIDEIGDISWSNDLKNNISFIDSIFKFQLQSKLKCMKCKKYRYKFETYTVFDLPLPLPLSNCKMVTVEVFLYRLPFIYKVYFDKINKNFQDYLNKNSDKSYTQILWNYYSNVLTSEEKKQHVIELHFSFDLESNKKMLDIIKILRGIIILNLEPEKITKIYDNENLTEIKFELLTDFITYSKEKKRIIYPSSKIDEFVNSKDKIILNIYEVLNTLGLKKLLLKKDDNKNQKIFLYGFLHKKH